ncbi:TetR/AcrR family transcriptional regulator [uncultured Sphingomonas sp.]|uniref:TetR/AcrR family transcriptional regulator n=1 Tax=uncultured Sphingomonas sp. TaxID=158754 RepID=UPI0025D9E411|nr:TetR/AcrR family transcriptional regulator [uncultured Sphingomonas sp.]
MTDDAEPRPTRAPRRDAALRRDALIAAAADCFTTYGYGVPLETIAAAAGVGRATLYRNFPDRAALALAIFSRGADRFEAMLDPGLPIGETIEQLVRAGAESLALFARIAAELHLDHANIGRFQELRGRMERILAPALTAAQARGEVADDISPRDLVLTIRMASSLVQPFLSDEEVSVQVQVALRLLLNGLRPR